MLGNQPLGFLTDTPFVGVPGSGDGGGLSLPEGVPGGRAR